MKRHLRTILNAGAVCIGFVIYILFLILVFVKWLVLRFIGLLTFLVVAFLYLVSFPIPFLGRVLMESESRLKLPEINFAKRLERFREDMFDIMANKHTARSSRSKQSLEAEIQFLHQKAKKKHEVGELLISFYGGIIALLLGYFGYWEYLSYVLSAYILILIVSIIVRMIVIDLLAVNPAASDDWITKRELELMLGWQRAVLSRSRTQLEILFLAFLGFVHGPSYEIAKGKLEEHWESGISNQEFIKAVSDDIRGQED